MFQNLQLFRLAGAMAEHASQRQGIIAKNIANADTPGYKAQDITSFAQNFQNKSTTDIAIKSTRVGHQSVDAGGNNVSVVRRDDGYMEPNGNTVSVETEMVHAVEAKRQHDRAIAIYRSSMTILRSSLG